MRGNDKKANPYIIKLVFPLEKLHPVDIPAGENDLGIEEGQFEKEANGLIDEFAGMAEMGCDGRVTRPCRYLKWAAEKYPCFGEIGLISYGADSRIFSSASQMKIIKQRAR